MAGELFGLTRIVLAFVVLGLAALRFGVDTRRTRSDRPNW